MNDVVLSWLGEQVKKYNFPEPIVEYGSLQVGGQEGYADIRRFFTGKRFTGCDFREGLGVDVVDNMENSCFKDGEVGTVVCLETLEHVKHPCRALREARRILKPGGYLLVSSPMRMGIHDYPADYWRMTADGLSILLADAGFEEYEAEDTGEEFEFDLTWMYDESPERPRGSMVVMPFPVMTFGIARKSIDDVPGAVSGPAPSLEAQGPVKPLKSVARTSEPVPIVVALFHREEEAKEMFEQLARVTDNYSLIIVDNGFDDPEYIESLKPSEYVRNETNNGVIQAVNQGLAFAKGDYVAVLHSDIMIYDEGWLDHILKFMDRRPEVGIVGLAGRHTITEKGSVDEETTVMNLRGFTYSKKPTWRMAEVATIDGVGWVMRNNGMLLDERYGMMHYYDLDLSMQFIDAGFKVYAAAVDHEHYGSILGRSARCEETYLEEIDRDDEAYMDERREMFRSKWERMLPMSRGFQDEAYTYYRINELQAEVELLRNVHRTDTEYMEEQQRYMEEQQRYVDGAKQYIKSLEEEEGKKGAELEKSGEYARKLEQMIAHQAAALAADEDGEVTPMPDGQRKAGKFGLFRMYMGNEGFFATCKRLLLYASKKFVRK